MGILKQFQVEYVFIDIVYIKRKITRSVFTLKKANWDRYCKEIEDKLRKRRLPTNCQKGEKILRTIILKAASQHIPSGPHRINTEPVSEEILERMRARDNLRSHLARPATDERRDHQNNKRTLVKHVETLDHKTDRTIKAIDGKSPPKAENEAITFDDSQVSFPMQIANHFNRQFTTSKLGRHT